MKGILALLFLVLVWVYPTNYLYGQNPADRGSIKGAILLSAKSTVVNTGGRYGRSTRTAKVSATTKDSVLIWLESQRPGDESSSQNPAILDQEDLAFSPSILVVRQNGTVRIQNSDPVYHNVFSLSPVKRFDVGRRPKGEYLDVEFNKPGVVDVFCDIHSNMRATIYVMPNNAISWTKIKSGSEFILKDLEPGNYRLNIYALGYHEQSLPIEVNIGETTDIGTITLNQ